MLHSRANTLQSVRRVTERNAGRLTAGVDGEVVLTPEAKAKLVDRVHQMSEPFKAMPVRRVYIPKRGSSTKRRPLGIPVILDRCHQARVVSALEPEWEARFEPKSYGFRPGRGCHDAIEAIYQVAKGKRPRRLWALDADLAGALEPSSHCQRVHGGGVEQGCFGFWDQYSQAFSASVADVEGLQLAALDTLQHGLAGDAEDPHRVDDRNVAGWGVLDEQRAELVVDADPPRGAGRVLLAADEPGLQPAEDRGGGDAEFVGGLADGEQLAVGRLGGRLVRGDAAVAAQPADDDRGEPLAAGGAAALAVEDPGDPSVVVVERRAARSARSCPRRCGSSAGGFGSVTASSVIAPPFQRIVTVARRCSLVGVDGHFLDQAAEQLLAVAVGGRRRGPHAAEVGAERQQPLALLRR